MKLNYHGIKMTGIKKTAGLTKQLTHETFRSDHVEIFFDAESEKVFGIWHPQKNEWSIPHGQGCVAIADVYSPQTMQDVADLVKWKKPLIELVRRRIK